MDSNSFVGFVQTSDIVVQTQAFLGALYQYFSNVWVLGGIWGIISFIIVIAIAYFLLTKLLNIPKAISLAIGIIIAVLTAGFIVTTIYGLVLTAKGLIGV